MITLTNFIRKYAVHSTDTNKTQHAVIACRSNQHLLRSINTLLHNFRLTQVSVFRVRNKCLMVNTQATPGDVLPCQATSMALKFADNTNNDQYASEEILAFTLINLRWSPPSKLVLNPSAGWAAGSH